MANSLRSSNGDAYNTTQTQHLRALAQSNLVEIQADIEADTAQQATTARDLQKYAKVRRKDRPKQTPSPPLTAPLSKGSKLRSAQDVLDRLRHDPALKNGTYYIGYLERFEGIREMLADSWISESTDEYWIPQHRIKYVRREDGDGRSLVVWDRERRIDRIFGSGVEEHEYVDVDDGVRSEVGGLALT